MPDTQPSLIVRKVLATLIPAEGKVFSVSLLFLPFALVAIFSMILPIALLDIWTTFYQYIYFTTMGIPMISRRQYLVMERWDLSKLTFMQKINCVYCEYVNGVLAFARAVAHQTEIYSCAIRYRHALKESTHQETFYPSEKFE